MIISTPADMSANSYVSIADADAFFEGEVVSAAWTDATELEKERALRAATSMLESFDFIGQRTTQTQALKWPRFLGEFDEVFLGAYQMPKRLLRVTARLAYALITDPVQEVQTVSTDRAIKREKVGPIETEYFEGTVGSVERIGLARYPSVLADLQPLLESHGYLTTVRA